MSLLDRSKQRWKLTLFVILMSLGAVITLLQTFLSGPLGKELTVQLAFGGMILIIGTFVWAGDNIICPKCRLRLLYYAITKVGLGTWYQWLTDEEKCPKCHFNGDDKLPAKGQGKWQGKKSR